MVGEEGRGRVADLLNRPTEYVLGARLHSLLCRHMQSIGVMDRLQINGFISCCCCKFLPPQYDVEPPQHKPMG